MFHSIHGIGKHQEQSMLHPKAKDCEQQTGDIKKPSALLSSLFHQAQQQAFLKPSGRANATRALLQ
jgi:hypothetical protein